MSVGGCALVFAARVATAAPKWCFAIRHAESGWNRALATGDVVALLGTIDHGLTRAGVAQARGLADELAAARCSAVAGSLEPGQEKGAKSPTSKGSYLDRFPLVSADLWTSDHLSERS